MILLYIKIRNFPRLSRIILQRYPLAYRKPKQNSKNYKLFMNYCFFVAYIVLLVRRPQYALYDECGTHRSTVAVHIVRRMWYTSFDGRSTHCIAAATTLPYHLNYITKT